MILSSAIEGFILAKTGQLSPRTTDDYRFYLNLWLEQAGDREMRDFTRQDVQRFLAWLATDYRTRDDKPLGQSGQRHGWIALRSFWAWAAADLGLDNVAQGVSGPRMPDSAVVPFTRSDVEALLQAVSYSRWVRTKDRATFRYSRAESTRDRALLLVMLDTGVRVGELCRLDVPDVDLRNRILEVKGHRAGTKSRPRTIPLTGRTSNAAWRYLTERQEAGETFTRDTPLFVAARGPEGAGGRLSRYAVYHLLTRLGERAEVTDVHPHRFRHTFAVEYLRGGGNPWMLKHLLGHSTMAMVERYLHFVGQDYHDVHQRASAVERWRL